MKPSHLRTILLFIFGLGAGYGLIVVISIVLLGSDLRQFNFGALTILAVVIAVLLVVIFNAMFRFDLADRRDEGRGVEYEFNAAGEAVPRQPSLPGFPYEEQSEHWDVDFSDSKQTYQGTELPLWLLAGWAAFILWAIIYLVSGLPSAL